MGFSNNKWRKILTILMIINLAIILLSKLSKVFAYSFDIPAYNTTFNMPEWLDDKKYIFLFNNDNKNFILFWANEEFKMNYEYNYIRVYGIPSGVRTSGAENRYTTLESFETWLNELTYEKYNDTSTTVNITVRNSFGTSLNVSHFCNFDVYNSSNQLVFENTVPTFNYPFFDNSTEIQNGNPDGVYISAGDYSNTDNLYFHLLQIDTGLSNSDTSVYYYSDKTFTLNKDSEYYRTWYDPNIEGYYYFIPRYELGLSQNTSYLYVLNNSNNQIQNSYGIYSKDVSNGIYDVVQSDTAGVITATEEESDRMKNIEQTLINNQNSMENIENTITDSNVSQQTQTDIDTNLNFNNNAPQFSSLFNGFFSRLTSTISDLGNYQDTDVITVNLPIPFTNDTIPIRSDLIFSNQNNNFLKNISTLLWYFIFGRYFLYFLINTYWLITNGQFFKFYLTQKEAITSDML